MDSGQSTLLSSSVASQPLFLTKSASKSSTPILGSRLKTAQIQIIGSSWTDTWSELLWTDPVDTFLQTCAGEKTIHKTTQSHQHQQSSQNNPPTSSKEYNLISLININNLLKVAPGGKTSRWRATSDCPRDRDGGDRYQHLRSSPTNLSWAQGLYRLNGGLILSKILSPREHFRAKDFLAGSLLYLLGHKYSSSQQWKRRPQSQNLGQVTKTTFRTSGWFNWS